MDRRAIFFLCAAVISGLLTPATDQDLRFVPIALGVLYLLLALASWLDWYSRQRGSDAP